MALIPGVVGRSSASVSIQSMILCLASRDVERCVVADTNAIGMHRGPECVLLLRDIPGGSDGSADDVCTG